MASGYGYYEHLVSTASATGGNSSSSALVPSTITPSTGGQLSIIEASVGARVSISCRYKRNALACIKIYLKLFKLFKII